MHHSISSTLSFLLLSLLLPHSITSTEAPSKSKGPYKVLRVLPRNEDELKFLRGLYETASDYDLTFWKEPRGIGAICDVMIPPEFQTSFPKLLTEKEMNFTVTIPDVERLIEERQNRKKKNIQFGPVLRDQSSGPHYDFNSYQSYTAMRQYMNSLAGRYPNIARNIRLGTTHEGRPIEGMKIGYPVSSNRKKIIWIDGGMHAREWAASTVALFFIKELTTKYSSDPEIKHLVDNLNWVIVPQVNPDGYEFSRSGKHPNVRLWRKNMSPKQCVTNRFGRKKCCKGVDLNRNFDFHWGESGSSTNPCDEIFQGNFSFSEPEAQAIRDFITPRKHQLDAFITLHTYAQIWAHAFGHERRQYPPDVTDLRRVGLKAADALKKMYGTKYRVGSGADTLYPASGGSDDWAKDVMGAKFVYLLELRPDESEWEGFILDEEQLIPAGRETFEAVKVVGEEVLKRNGIPTYHSSITSPSPRSSRPTISRERSRFQGRKQNDSCEDKRFSCQRWVKNNPNLCQTIRHFMGEQCPVSCNLCSSK